MTLWRRSWLRHRNGEAAKGQCRMPAAWERVLLIAILSISVVKRRFNQVHFAELSRPLAARRLIIYGLIY